MPAVSVRGLSKKYRIFPSPGARLKENLSFGRIKYGKDFYALREVDLTVEPGAALGILGRNGAGKSTLLGIISGLMQPTSGSVEVNGRVVALSGSGAGFDSEMTGRENVMLNSMVLGMKRQEILRRFDDIAEFADIAEHMDQPLKTFSSGMRSRLGFAVAINMEPDILIMDETLSPRPSVQGCGATEDVRTTRFWNGDPASLPHHEDDRGILHRGHPAPQRTQNSCWRDHGGYTSLSGLGLGHPGAAKKPA